MVDLGLACVRRFFLFPEGSMKKRARVLLVRLGERELASASGGVVVKVVVTHANIKVEVEDDRGVAVDHRRADLSVV